MSAQLNRLQTVVSQAKALAGVIGSAVLSDDEPSPGEVNWTCQVMIDLLHEAETIATGAEVRR